MCYKCDWNGSVRKCSNKITKKNNNIIEKVKTVIKSTVGKVKYDFDENKSLDKEIVEFEKFFDEKRTEMIDDCLKIIADMQKINTKDDKK